MTNHNRTRTSPVERWQVLWCTHGRENRVYMTSGSPQLVVDRELVETGVNPCVSQFFALGGQSVAAHGKLVLKTS